MRSIVFAGAAVCATLVACGGDGGGEQVGQTGHEIVGGTIDTGHPAVAELNIDVRDVFGKVYTKYSSCTGTLVSSRVLVSAAHCVAGHVLKDPRGFPDLKIVGAHAYFGTYADKATDAEFKVVQEAHAHPSYDGTVASPYDISVWVLADPVDIAPVPFAQAALPATVVGSNVTSVGFGKTQSTDGFSLGEKRSVVTTISALSADGKHFDHGKAGSSTCQGDSGGPELLKISGVETIIGITSYGPAKCETGGATAVRIDAHADFVNQTIRASSSPAPSPTPTPTPSPTPTPAPSTGADYTCVINGTVYSCPDKASYDKCAGFDVAACLSACAGKAACAAICRQKATAATHDPSGCTQE